jgi:hypothetical protein
MTLRIVALYGRDRDGAAAPSAGTVKASTLTPDWSFDIRVTVGPQSELRLAFI